MILYNIHKKNNFELEYLIYLCENEAITRNKIIVFVYIENNAFNAHILHNKPNISII